MATSGKKNSQNRKKKHYYKWILIAAGFLVLVAILAIPYLSMKEGPVNVILLTVDTFRADHEGTP